MVARPEVYCLGGCWGQVWVVAMASGQYGVCRTGNAMPIGSVARDDGSVSVNDTVDEADVMDMGTD